eukprot:GHRR01028817.1.p1 GENE.GHRR01028817.1~~GHRR01028817.1.p1  ORF type:complete len:141 (+),score=30.98 GHRR01028817.1:63-425(+)
MTSTIARDAVIWTRLRQCVPLMLVALQHTVLTWFWLSVRQCPTLNCKLQSPQEHYNSDQVCTLPYKARGFLTGRIATLLYLQVNQLLEVGDKAQGMNKYVAMEKWANQVKSIHQTVCNRA